MSSAIQTRDRHAITDLVKERFEIPTIPLIATKVALELHDPDASAQRLSRLIANDQGLTTRILSVANSSFYGAGQEVSSVQQAVVTLGFDMIQGLVVCFSTRKIYQRFGPAERSLWEHAMATAIACDLIAKRMGLACRKNAFVAGLMHDVGKVVLSNRAPETFHHALGLARTMKLSSVDAEQQAFGINHCDVGMVLVKQWDLAPALVQSTFLHHDLDLAEATAPDDLELVVVVHLANRICHFLGIGTAAEREHPGAHDRLDDLRACPAAATLSIDAVTLDELMAGVEKSYNEERALFG
jgi:putative nucleotidyltransferase with HDIG domain